MRAHKVAGGARQHCCHALSGNSPPLPMLAKRLRPILFSPDIAAGSRIHKRWIVTFALADLPIHCEAKVAFGTPRRKITHVSSRFQS